MNAIFKQTLFIYNKQRAWCVRICDEMLSARAGECNAVNENE